MSQDIKTVLASKFTLAQTPDSGTVTATIDGVATTAFSVNGNVVEFSPAPADTSIIVIDYQYGAQPIANSWILRYQPYSGSTSVAVAGTQLSNGDFSIDYATKTVTIPNTPADSASINVTYRRNDSLENSWSYFGSVKPGSMRAFVNNVETTDFTVASILLGLKFEITFGSPPGESASIRLEYLQPGNAVTTYPFNAEYGTPIDLRGNNKANGDVIRVSYANNAVTVNSDDWVEGMDLVLTYDNVDRQEFEVPLPQAPIENSIVAKADGVTCKDSLELVGQTVNVHNCGFTDATTEVDVYYDFLVEQKHSFEFIGAVPAVGEYQNWQVFLDDVETSDYTRTGKTIAFNFDLPLYTEVKIKVTVEK
jgi:hypothetical protein